ncbi:MAG: hypothetical protein KDG51_08900, partial [Calditrichaeota bacterium]|nr:hypothetical protein [Calditrichota bacterium]
RSFLRPVPRRGTTLSRYPRGSPGVSGGCFRHTEINPTETARRNQSHDGGAATAYLYRGISVFEYTSHIAPHKRR